MYRCATDGPLQEPATGTRRTATRVVYINRSNCTDFVAPLAKIYSVGSTRRVTRDVEVRIFPLFRVVFIMT